MLKLGEIKPGSAIVDMDDVLVYTSNLWYKFIMDKYNIFEPYLDKDVSDNTLYNYKDYFNYPLTRPTYLFSDWLLKKDLSEVDRNIAIEFIFEAYKEHFVDFYDIVKPTNLVQGLNLLFGYKHFKIDRLYIVTRTLTGFESGKTKCIQRLFSPIINNVEILFLERFEKKSDVVKDIKNISLIIDDELHNIYDYMDNCNENINDSVIMLPLTGYNSPVDPKYLELAKKKNIIIQHYTYDD